MEYDEMLREEAEECRKVEWHFEVWIKKPALVDRSSGGRAFYIGQKYNPKKQDLVADGWDHDHCAFCCATICDHKDEDNNYTETWTDGNKWLCPPCYEETVRDGKDPVDVLKVRDIL